MRRHYIYAFVEQDSINYVAQKFYRIKIVTIA